MTDKFEYHTFMYSTDELLEADNWDFESELTKLGLEGWELVSSVAINQGYGQTRYIMSIFKRKVGKL